MPFLWCTPTATLSLVFTDECPACSWVDTSRNAPPGLRESLTSEAESLPIRTLLPHTGPTESVVYFDEVGPSVSSPSASILTYFASLFPSRPKDLLLWPRISYVGLSSYYWYSRINIRPSIE